MIDTSNPAYKHGGAGRKQKHPLYNTWCSIVDRTTNPNSERYEDYGGRGIAMCAEWRHDFPRFTQDMGERPAGTSIDRIDNDKGYSKDNCHWATPTEQSRNRRNRRRWEWMGFNLMLSEWAEILEMDFDCLRGRLDTRGHLFPPQPEIYRTREKSGRLEIYLTTDKKYYGSVDVGSSHNDILEHIRKRSLNA